ncbi:MAG: hypothetical protein E3J86_07660 [Candidatus Thorarchaeota archaeon]|nr:MAG: hypothetical protein E3J86_07660 [Candidatus Thorarchaeota archaeon]
MTISLEEQQESVPKTRDFTRFIGYYLLNLQEVSVALISVFFVSYYTFYSPQGSDWIPGLENASMALIYLALSFIGFMTNIVLTVKTNRRLSTEGSIRVSLARGLILYAPPFAILAGPCGALLTVALGGVSGLSMAMGAVILYGFVIGFLVGRLVSKIVGLRPWRATQIENDTKRGYFRDVIISHSEET